MMIQKLKLGIAATGVALSLLACNGGPEDMESAPEPGPVPAPGQLEISISPHSGPHGASVTIQAAGFEPGARVGIGMGPPQSEYDIFAHATAGSDGRVSTTVEVPDWTEPGRDYLFAAQAPDGADVISSAFRVTAGDAGPGSVDPGSGEPGSGEPGSGERVSVTGELTDEGVECQALRGDDGRLYTLAGRIDGFGAGDRVHVEGTVAEMSFCMQGTTLSVEQIRGAG